MGCSQPVSSLIFFSQIIVFAPLQDCRLMNNLQINTSFGAICSFPADCILGQCGLPGGTLPYNLSL